MTYPFAKFVSLQRAARALLDSIDFDNNGAMVAGRLVGGNGGLISRETIKAADELRKALTEAAHE